MHSDEKITYSKTTTLQMPMPINDSETLMDCMSKDRNEQCRRDSDFLCTFHGQVQMKDFKSEWQHRQNLSFKLRRLGYGVGAELRIIDLS